MPRCLLALCLTAFACVSGRADDQGLLRFVDEQTILVGSLDISKAGLDALAEKFLVFAPASKVSVAQDRERMTKLQQVLREAGVTFLYFQISAAEVQLPPAVMIPLRKAGDAEKIKAVLPGGGPGKGEFAWEVVDNYLVGGWPAARERLRLLKPSSRPDLQAAMQGIEAGALQVYFVPSKDSRRVWEELVPTLPKELGGGSIRLLTREVQWAALTADLTPRLQGRAMVQTTGAQHAAAVRELWLKLLGLLKSEQRESSPSMTKLLLALFEQLPVEVRGNQVVVRPEPALVKKVVTTFTQNIGRISAQSLAASRLRRIVIAMHNYHTDFAKLPAQAIRSKDGKPLLSWRVALLPYLEQNELYKEFKLDEPWDSEHNKRLLSRMPDIFRHPAVTEGPADHTYFQVFYSMKAMKPGAALLQDGHTTLGQLTVQDGTSNTFLVTDAAATAVPWTRPDDLLFDPGQPLPKLGSVTKDGYAQVGFCDGHVLRFRIAADPKLLRQLIGRNDGENADVSEVFK